MADITVHSMVKDEINTISASLRSVAPHCQQIICIDTGSTDGTWETICSLKHKLGNLLAYRIPVQEASHDWTTAGSSWASSTLTDIRNIMIHMTKTKYSWIVDGDEVYTNRSARAVSTLVEIWPKDVLAWRLPMVWFAQDRYHIAEIAVQGGEDRFITTTTRLFLNDDKLTVKGAFPIPGEMHHYDGVVLERGARGVQVADWMDPICHYEMLYKPWRRAVASVKDYEGAQPECFNE